MMTGVSVGGVDFNMTQQWGYYESFDSSSDAPGEGTGESQCSGAYIFRPSKANATFNVISPAIGKATIYKSTEVTEVHMQLSESWIQQVVRIIPGVPYVEVDYTVGPIPIDDDRGKEVVVRYGTPIRSNGVFYTDSNGREFLKRTRNNRPTWNLTVHQPIAGNYYPVNAAIYIEDRAASMSVLVDRSQGGSSVVDGSIELMVQRRNLKDDWRGVGEPMNETDGGITPNRPFGDESRVGSGVVIRGRHRIMIGEGGVGAKLSRSQMDSAFADPVVLVGSSSSSKGVIPLKAGNFSLLQMSLPSNVMLVTLARLHDGESECLLVRLGHQYDKEEDAELSKPVVVDLAKLLVGYEVMSVTEKTLSGNQNYTDWLARRLDWTTSSSNEDMQAAAASEEFSSTEFEIQPMEIKTFEVCVQ